MTMRTQMPAPPKGFRKAIPASVKVDVVIQQAGACKACGEKLTAYADTQFDHVPAIQLRAWSEDDQDTIPPSNSVDHIEAKHHDCHAQKTTGRKGESRAGAVNGDTTLIAKQRRLEKQEAEFRQRLLAKDTGEEPEVPKKKHRWPKRRMQSGGANGSKPTRDQESRSGTRPDRRDRGLRIQPAREAS